MALDDKTQAALRSEIGPWSEIKLEIIRKYAHAYSKIFNSAGQSHFYHIYVDAFAGAGFHLSKGSGALVPGSPKIALDTIPAFREFHFIDIQDLRVRSLERMGDGREEVFVHHGDANQVLMEEILPRLEYADFRRGLCLLDPYGIHYGWDLVEAIGKKKTVDLFLNFPIMDINMNALHKASGRLTDAKTRRMNTFWGDDSWQDDFYSKNVQLGLFGEEMSAKDANNDQVVRAYMRRLRELAGFRHVPDPLPMRNGIGRTVYYLIFATHNQSAKGIAEDIYRRYR